MELRDRPRVAALGLVPRTTEQGPTVRGENAVGPTKPPLENMMATPVRLDKMPPTTHIRGVVYGGPGVGKTTFAGTSQTMRTLIMDVDIGTSVLRARPDCRKDLVEVVTVRSLAAFIDAVKYLQAHISSYDLLVVDTLTEFQQIYLAERVAADPRIEIPDQRVWGLALNKMCGLIRTLAPLPVHQLFLAHEVMATDVSGRRFYRPSFQGAFVDHYARHVDIIIRYLLSERRVQVEGSNQYQTVTDHLLQCQRDPFTHAKDRFNTLGLYEWPVIDPLFDKILRTLRTGDNGGQTSNA